MGVFDLRIGMPKFYTKKYLGQESETLTYEQEEKQYLDHDHDPTKFIPFELGFDEVLVFDSEQSAPVFKLHFQRDDLVYITLSAYPLPEIPQEQEEKMLAREVTEFYKKNAKDGIKNFRFRNGIKFLVSTNFVKNHLGEPEEIVYLKNYEIYIYYHRGLRFTFDQTIDNLLTVINLYAPIYKKNN